MMKRLSKVFGLTIAILFLSAGVALACYKPPVDICVGPDNECPVNQTVTPTEEISQAPTDTPEEPTATPSPDVTATPSATATPAPQASSGGDGKGDGKSDGRSDGLCSKPPCITPGAVLPQGAPATGRGR